MGWLTMIQVSMFVVVIVMYSNVRGRLERMYEQNRKTYQQVVIPARNADTLYREIKTYKEAWEK